MLLPTLARQAPSPRDAVAHLEARPHLPSGPGEHFTGYGVLGVTFKSGDTLALRRYAATSVGPPYTSVWHRTPEGHWTLYQDLEPDAGCGRYFSMAADVVRAGIRVVWTGSDRFGIIVDAERTLTWKVVLASTAMTRAANCLASTLSRSPDWPGVSGASAIVSGAMLRTGSVATSAITPNGFTLHTQIDRVWIVADSHVMLGGHSLGLPVLSRSARIRLGALDIPRHALFATVQAHVHRRAPEHDAR